MGDKQNRVEYSFSGPSVHIKRILSLCRDSDRNKVAIYDGGIIITKSKEELDINIELNKYSCDVNINLTDKEITSSFDTKNGIKKVILLYFTSTEVTQFLAGLQKNSICEVKKIRGKSGFVVSVKESKGFKTINNINKDNKPFKCVPFRLDKTLAPNCKIRTQEFSEMFKGGKCGSEIKWFCYRTYLKMDIINGTGGKKKIGGNQFIGTISREDDNKTPIVVANITKETMAAFSKLKSMCGDTSYVFIYFQENRIVLKTCISNLAKIYFVVRGEKGESDNSSSESDQEKSGDEDDEKNSSEEESSQSEKHPKRVVRTVRKLPRK